MSSNSDCVWVSIFLLLLLLLFLFVFADSGGGARGDGGGGAAGAPAFGGQPFQRGRTAGPPTRLHARSFRQARALLPIAGRGERLVQQYLMQIRYGQIIHIPTWLLIYRLVWAEVSRLGQQYRTQIIEYQVRSLLRYCM